MSVFRLPGHHPGQPAAGQAVLRGEHRVRALQQERAVRAGQSGGQLQLQPLVRGQELPDQPQAAADRGRRQCVPHDDHRLWRLLLLLQGQEEETHSR